MDQSLHVAEHADTWARCYRRDSLHDNGTTTLRSHALCRHTGWGPPPAPNQIFKGATPRPEQLARRWQHHVFTIFS